MIFLSLKKVINLYISYTLGPQSRDLNTDFTLFNCLFGSIKLTKNADLDKYRYTGYGLGTDSCSEFLFTDGSYGKYVNIFGADMSSCVHVDNKGKNILILGEGPTQVLYGSTFTARQNILLILHNPEKDLYSVYTIMEATVSYLLMLQKYINTNRKTLK